jgi:hypothetical protein
LISAELQRRGDLPLRTYPPQRRAKADIPHGTTSRYTNRDCRCELCKAAQRAYYTAWKQRRGAA